ncbi:hypothetical protein LCGC14_1511700, partial [marine sediment metagenome]
MRDTFGQRTRQRGIAFGESLWLALATVRLAIRSTAGWCLNNGPSTPRTAPPAPSTRMGLSFNVTLRFSVR